MSWIDKYGDRDGDGFQEYQTRSPVGYENMGWKDSGDCVVYPDGVVIGLELNSRRGHIFEDPGEAERVKQMMLADGLPLLDEPPSMPER